MTGGEEKDSTARPLGTVPASSSDDDFVGRQSDLDKISTLVIGGSRRMISLVGPPGIGKTRLAAEVVQCVRADKRAAGMAIHWVRLARLSEDSDVEVVARETASAVVKSDLSDRSGFQALVDTLNKRPSAGRARRTVLVFDNCEHVEVAVRSLIADLLEAVPELTVVATSLSPVRWVNEHIFTVGPLSQAEATELFWQRTELYGRVSAGQVEDDLADDICRHIDYNPLLIQLAASEAEIRPLAQIHAELTGHVDSDKRMRWSRGPLAGVEDRHRKVTAGLERAWRLCSDKEQLLWARLSVFAGGGGRNPDATDTTVGADLEAIKAVCADPEDLEPGDGPTLSRDEIEDTLTQLARRSLLEVHVSTTTVQYSLLESLRLYAWARLKETGSDQAQQLVQRHLHYYMGAVGNAAAHWFGPAEIEFLTWALGAWGNILTAIEASISLPGEACAGLKIVAGVIRLRVLFVRGSIGEIRELAERCLEASRDLTPEPTELQISVMAALGWLSVRQGIDAQHLIDECMAAYTSDSEWREHPEIDYGQPAMVDILTGTEGFMSRRDPRAIGVLLRARAKFHEQGDHGGEVFAVMFAGLAAAVLGSREQAWTISLGGGEYVGKSGAAWAYSWTQLPMAVTEIYHGDPSEGAKILAGTLDYQRGVGDQWGSHWSVLLRSWALAEHITGDADNVEQDRQLATDVARVAAGAHILRAEIGVILDKMGTFADATDRALEKARQVLGTSSFSAEFDRVVQMDLNTEEVYDLVSGNLSLDPIPAGSLWNTLTSKEQRVAIRVAAGYSNPEIGQMLGNSARTIDRHMTSIFHKLDISSRRDVEAIIPDRFKTEVNALASRGLTQANVSSRRAKR